MRLLLCWRHSLLMVARAFLANDPPIGPLAKLYLLRNRGFASESELLSRRPDHAAWTLYGALLALRRHASQASHTSTKPSS